MNLLLQRLGLMLPIIQGPMTGSDTPALAAAVSKAGGLGMLGCGMRSPAAMLDAAQAVRDSTDRPFGMNLFVLSTPRPEPAVVESALERLAPIYAELGIEPAVPSQWCEDFDAQLEALIAARPAVASFTFGILTTQQVQRLKQEANCLVMGTATTVKEALAWEAVGADAVCVSGMEAGGHRGSFLRADGSYPDPQGLTLQDFAAGMVSTVVLVPQCANVLRIPVIAAGGIMDGRGIAAAQVMGAQAVQMGTAFLACPESGITLVQRAAMAGAEATDTRTTRVFSGRPARGIVNNMMLRLAEAEATVPAYPIQNALTGPLRRAAAAQQRCDYLALWAGQGVGAARALPAEELVALLALEWRAALAAHEDIMNEWKFLP